MASVMSVLRRISGFVLLGVLLLCVNSCVVEGVMAVDDDCVCEDVVAPHTEVAAAPRVEVDAAPPGKFAEVAEHKTSRQKGNGKIVGHGKSAGHGKSDGQVATREEMIENLVPLPYRDACAHLLIPLNKCRRETYYLPWKCEDQRHVYEKCEYELFLKRVRKMEELRGYRQAS